MRRIPLRYNREQEFWDKANARAWGKEKVVVQEETETELYAVFVKGLLVEKGSREVPVK